MPTLTTALWRCRRTLWELKMGLGRGTMPVAAPVVSTSTLRFDANLVQLLNRVPSRGSLVTQGIGPTPQQLGERTSVSSRSEENVPWIRKGHPEEIE